MAEILGQSNVQEELGIKRFYLPGFMIKDNCPRCKTENIRDLRQHYLSYPTSNKPLDFPMYCQECEAEWKIEVILRMNLELAKP